MLVHLSYAQLLMVAFTSDPASVVFLPKDTYQDWLIRVRPETDDSAAYLERVPKDRKAFPWAPATIDLKKRDYVPADPTTLQPILGFLIPESVDGSLGSLWDQFVAAEPGTVELHRADTWGARPKMAVRWTGSKIVFVTPGGDVQDDDAWHPDFDDVRGTDWVLRPVRQLEAASAE